MSVKIGTASEKERGSSTSSEKLREETPGAAVHCAHSLYDDAKSAAHLQQRLMNHVNGAKMAAVSRKRSAYLPRLQHRHLQVPPTQSKSNCPPHNSQSAASRITHLSWP
jgi:hypothetical protein